MGKLRIAVYVTGSIANYKTLILVRALKKRGNQVRVVMTRNACRFIRPLSFQALSGMPVITDQLRPVSSHGILHVDLARWTDLAIVMPATANVIAKMAHGSADDVVSTCLLATSAPKLIVPAMNNVMLANPATQRNLALIRRDPGCQLLGPVTGRLAEGYSGRGRMMSVKQVVEQIPSLLQQRRLLTGQKILVTAGGTQEPLDPVRCITNHSSGKMGIAIAQVAKQMDADVWLICGHVTVPVPQSIRIQKVQTTEEMERAVLDHFPACNALIMAAALADFKPAAVAKQKIKKHSQTRFSLTLRKTPDVLKRIAKIKKPRQMTVGFAAETQHLLENATLKMKQKQLDLMVANNVADSRIGFGSDQNQVTILQPGRSPIQTPVESKRLIARRILEVVAQRLGSNGEN